MNHSVHSVAVQNLKPKPPHSWRIPNRVHDDEIETVFRFMWYTYPSVFFKHLLMSNLKPCELHLLTQWILLVMIHSSWVQRVGVWISQSFSQFLNVRYFLSPWIASFLQLDAQWILDTMNHKIHSSPFHRISVWIIEPFGHDRFFHLFFSKSVNLWPRSWPRFTHFSFSESVNGLNQWIFRL